MLLKLLDNGDSIILIPADEDMPLVGHKPTSDVLVVEFVVMGGDQSVDISELRGGPQNSDSVVRWRATH